MSCNKTLRKLFFFFTKKLHIFGKERQHFIMNWKVWIGIKVRVRWITILTRFFSWKLLVPTYILHKYRRLLLELKLIRWSWTSLPIGKIYSIFTFSPCHGRQVPYITDNCPRSHHQVNVGCHSVLWGVPEGVAKDWVVLDGHWVDGTAHLEAAFLKLHHRRVVDASAFGENQNGQLGGVVHMLFQPIKLQQKCYSRVLIHSV